jgi:ribosome-binding factor A
MKSPNRHTQIMELLTQTAAEYFARESNGTSLITVTRTDLSPDMHKANIYLSVLPVESEESVLHFARRSRAEFRMYINKHTRMGRAPTVDFIIDEGEKNRQRIDELTRS